MKHSVFIKLLKEKGGVRQSSESHKGVKIRKWEVIKNWSRNEKTQSTPLLDTCESLLNNTKSRVLPSHENNRRFTEIDLMVSVN